MIFAFVLDLKSKKKVFSSFVIEAQNDFGMLHMMFNKCKRSQSSKTDLQQTKGKKRTPFVLLVQEHLGMQRYVFNKTFYS